MQLDEGVRYAHVSLDSMGFSRFRKNKNDGIEMSYRRLAEKTIELTACAQFAQQLTRIHPSANVVWFGLTQKQEKEFGFDAAMNLGGWPFILQFKASAKVISRGRYAGRRKFWLQHHQMTALVNNFGHLKNCCFYFFPNAGTESELIAFGGDLIGNSFLMDVASLPSPVPESLRTSGHHYAYLDASTPRVSICSDPFNVQVRAAADVLKTLITRVNGDEDEALFFRQQDMRTLAQRFQYISFRNAILGVITRGNNSSFM